LGSGTGRGPGSEPTSEPLALRVTRTGAPFHVTAVTPEGANTSRGSAPLVSPRSASVLPSTRAERTR
jgi:hypothetical protein